MGAKPTAGRLLGEHTGIRRSGPHPLRQRPRGQRRVLRLHAPEQPHDVGPARQPGRGQPLGGQATPVHAVEGVSAHRHIVAPAADEHRRDCARQGWRMSGRAGTEPAPGRATAGPRPPCTAGACPVFGRPQGRRVAARATIRATTYDPGDPLCPRAVRLLPGTPALVDECGGQCSVSATWEGEPTSATSAAALPPAHAFAADHRVVTKAGGAPAACTDEASLRGRGDARWESAQFGPCGGQEHRSGRCGLVRSADQPTSRPSGVGSSPKRWRPGPTHRCAAVAGAPSPTPRGTGRCITALFSDVIK